jgi:hypothetical protein
MKKNFWIWLIQFLLVLLIWPLDLTFGSQQSQSDYVQGYLLEAGMAWTPAAWGYYVITFSLVIIVVRYGYLRSSALPRWRRMLQAVLSLVGLPAVICFFNPIYEDMIWDLSADMSTVKTTSDYVDADLVVIAIADCPYCKRAVTELKALHERNSDMRMRMVVCTADSVLLEPYVEEAAGVFDVEMASDMDVMATHADGHFPAYVLVREGRPVCRWTNNEWGPRAKDIVEKGEGRGTRYEVR